MKKVKDDRMKRNKNNNQLLASVITAGILATSNVYAEESIAQGNMVVDAEKGVPGMTIVDTVEMSAKVTAIDTTNRKLTLLKSDEKETTITVGPEAVNFDQIEINDMVTITLLKELIISLNNEGVSTEESTEGMLASSPKGYKPSTLISETTVITANVVSLDQLKHTATLKFKDGSTETFSVRDDIDLSKHKIGEQVVFEKTEMIAIEVEKQKE